MCVNAPKDYGWYGCDSEPTPWVHSHGEGGIDIGMGIDGTRHDLEASHDRTTSSIGDGEGDKNLIVRGRVHAWKIKVCSLNISRNYVKYNVTWERGRGKGWEKDQAREKEGERESDIIGTSFFINIITYQIVGNFREDQFSCFFFGWLPNWEN